jgi:hypothetical protein
MGKSVAEIKHYGIYYAVEMPLDGLTTFHYLSYACHYGQFNPFLEVFCSHDLWRCPKTLKCNPQVIRLCRLEIKLPYCFDLEFRHMNLRKWLLLEIIYLLSWYGVPYYYVYPCETQGQRREEREISVEISPDHPGLC